MPAQNPGPRRPQGPSSPARPPRPAGGRPGASGPAGGARGPGGGGRGSGGGRGQGGRGQGGGGRGPGGGLPKRRPSGWQRVKDALSWKVLGGVAAAGALLLAVLFAIGYARTSIPDPNDLVDAQTSVVYYADGETEMGRFAAQNRQSVTIDAVPDHAEASVIAAEDRSFYENRGVSLTGIARAFWSNLTGESTQGGSTITQQYVKNYFLSAEQTYTRKIREAFIALKVDQELSKDEILESYLNTIYFGRGAYGIQTASQAYFGRDVQDLTPAQSAMLAGIIPAPNAWDPAKNPQRAQERWEYVLGGLVETGGMTAEERAALTWQADVLDTLVEPSDDELYRGPDGYILAGIRDELVSRAGLDETEVDTGGLRVVSTIARPVQEAAVAAMGDTEAFPTEGRPATLQAALVAIDPATGAIRAMYGGADYLERQRNAVTQDRLQPGSTFKPFTLVAALEQGVSLRTRFNGNSPREFDEYTDGTGTPVPVRNFGGTDFGRVNLVRATENSVNTVYVDLNIEVGAEATRDVAVRAGLPDDEVAANVSNVLGTDSVRPIDMAQAYATFAAQGVRHAPHLVASVSRGDTTVYQADTEGSRVFDEDVMADTTYALQQVVESGSGEFAANLGRPAAGKTGTTQENRAAWFAGFTPQLATVVALHNPGPQGEELPIPGFGGREQITGGSFPVRIWTSFMRRALDGAEVLDFPERADVGSIPRSQRQTTPPPRPEPEPTQEPEPEPTQEPTTEEPTQEPTQEPTPTGTGDRESDGNQDGDLNQDGNVNQNGNRNGGANQNGNANRDGNANQDGDPNRNGNGNGDAEGDAGGPVGGDTGTGSGDRGPAGAQPAAPGRWTGRAAA